MTHPTQPKILSSPLRIVFIFANLLLGIIPGTGFYAWVERNASLPQVGIEWGWPWISLSSWPTAALAAWDFSLFLLFGLIHSLFAQAPAQRLLEKLVPPQAVRTVYLIVTGLSLVGLMGLWQNTGIILWALPLGTLALNVLSLILFWGLIMVSGQILQRFDSLQFLGLKQIYMSTAELSRTEGTPKLLTTGIYGRVRHPIYTFTLAAFLITPFMTLDRMIVFAAAAFYLAFAIPVEERKLVKIFGTDYVEYRKRVPAVVPRSV